MDLRDETIAILNKYNLKAQKKLGQNFLINENVIHEIIKNAEITKDDVVIEIGPGLGSLTKELILNAKEVIAIELDKNMVDILNTRFKIFNNIKIIQADILKIDLKEFISNYKKVKIVANLPYYITTPIIMKLLESRINIDSITVMVQKEVGERICATHEDKAYGAITVSILYYSNPKMVINVPKTDFIPIPEVDSCVIKLDILEKPRVKVNDEKIFFKTIKTAFSQRRKTINNSLIGMGKSKEEIKDILLSLSIDEKLRAENLSIEQYALISNML